MKTSFFATLAVAALQLCSAHVRLTFPPARLPDYDFLDNVRTGGPCGVPGTPCTNTRSIHYSFRCELFAWFVSALAARENGTVTTLVAGSTIEISYHLAYPHRVR